MQEVRRQRENFISRALFSTLTFPLLFNIANWRGYVTFIKRYGSSYILIATENLINFITPMLLFIFSSHAIIRLSFIDSRFVVTTIVVIYAY